MVAQAVWRGNEISGRAVDSPEKGRIFSLSPEPWVCQSLAVLIYAVTIFLGAFLLFQVQPLIGKYILPWFGGGPGVWSACLLFFQAVLLAGYAYAHATTRWLRPRTQAVLHVVLLVLAVVLLPITPSEAWRPLPTADPTWRILLLLLASVGLPYFVLSSTGPLLQHWFSVTRAGVSPYRLYALSNLGSLLALLSYPVWFEANLSRRDQAGFWGWGLAMYVVACGFCAWGFWKASGSGGGAAREDSKSTGVAGTVAPGAPLLTRALWLLFPACASALLLATTNKLCLDVASVPFLWVAPLSLYLLSFIICFDSPRWYRRLPYLLALIAAMALLCRALFDGPDWPVWQQVTVYCAGLFVCCMVCHGELYRLRPEPSQLTGFYLMISAGGALGGLFVAVVSPWAFPDYYELHVGLLLCAALVLAVCMLDSGRRLGTFSSPKPSKSDPDPVQKAAEVEVPAALADAGQQPNASAAATACAVADPAAESGDTPNPFRPIPAAAELARQQGQDREVRAWRWMAVILTLAWFAAVDWAIVRWFAPGKWHAGYITGFRIGWWTLLAVLAIVWFARGSWKTFRYGRALSCTWLAAGVVMLADVLWNHARSDLEDAVYRSRNFYGVLTVHEYNRDDPLSHYKLLQHGRITHGLQFVDPEQARWRTSYYADKSGIGLALDAMKGARRVGVVGLGTGSLAAYGREGDYFRIYEINPEVTHLANSQFHYLRDSAAKIEVVPGDARLSMEREPAQELDLLALDAFSSDSIPVHLLTREAFAVYGRHMKTNGVIAVHISNHFLDLDPVVRSLAREFGYGVAAIDYEETDEEWWLYGSTWLLLTRDGAFLEKPEIADVTLEPQTNKPAPPLWTDDYASVFKILR